MVTHTSWHGTRPLTHARRGAQYIAGGIFFKRVSDVYGMYGSDDAAARAASHEMRGARAYLDAGIPGLRTALTVQIDYAGWRLLASAMLPIGSDSLLCVSQASLGRGAATVATSAM